MNNAIRVKNEMFKRGVNEALLRTVNRLEDIHNLGVVNEMIFEPDSVVWKLDSVRSYDFDFKNSEEFEWLGQDSLRLLHRQVSPSSGKPVQIVREFSPKNNEAIIEFKMSTDRITSYNVCYTKLLRLFLGENSRTI